jgi:hypothetical protein
MSSLPTCEHGPPASPKRIAREKKTVAAMLRIFCRLRHGRRGELCAECEELHRYAMSRLDRCPFGEDKPTCATCPIHCYKPQSRERIREVMRFAGPRMLWRHPLLAIRHVLDGRAAALAEPPRKTGQ